MRYVGKLFGQIGRTRGYFDTGKTSDDWDALEARAERAEAELAVANASIVSSLLYNTLKERLFEAEAELAGIRALADRRNKRDHSQDTTHQLVAALDQSIDIAQAELAAEGAKVRVLREACQHLSYVPRIQRALHKTEEPAPRV